MGNCPFHSDDAGRRKSGGRSGRRGLDRRAFVKSAVAIGGVEALSAVLSVGADADGPASMPYPNGDPSDRPKQQHRWSNAGYTDARGNPVAPAHQLVSLLEYVGDDVESDREAVEAAFTQLEEAFAYDQREGLVFNVGYSPAYFKRHSRGTPTDVDITEPRGVSPYNRPEFDRQDAFLQLASDEAAIVLAAESALLGEVSEVNGVAVEATFEGVFEVDDRRAVFAGPGLPRENITAADVHEHIEETSPLSMGYNSGFADSIPPEERVTIAEGPWADGTVAMVSKLRLRLRDWYENRDEDARIDEMFAPEYTREDVGDFGEGLGEGSGRGDGAGWERELTDRTDADARERGVVGHAQKVSRARDDDFGVKLLRHDGNITVGDGEGGLSFVGLVAGISDWFDVGEAMYDPRLDGKLRGYDGREGDGGRRERDQSHGRDDEPGHAGHNPRSGIAAQIDVRTRGHFLIPPRSLRSLPPSRPDA